MQIREDLKTIPYSNSSNPEIKKHVPKWHECSVSSPKGRVPKTLTISVSLAETDELLLGFQYSIHLRPKLPRKDRCSIMLCPQSDATKRLGPPEHVPRDAYCFICCVDPSVKSSKGCTRYDIEFTRTFGEYPGGLGDKFSDYNWRRYEEICFRI